MNHTETNCAALAAGICGRLHVDDTVRVTYGGRTQVGFMQTGTVVAQPDAGTYTVHFPDGVPVIGNDGEVLAVVSWDLTYSESELEKVSI